MIDVSPKFNTLRWAKATGVLRTSNEIIQRVKNNKVPKGNVLEVARAAGILAAKKTAEWIVFCHPIPLDWVEVMFELHEDKIEVFSEVKSIQKTGVEMEALTAVQAALMNMYDMLKPLTGDLMMTDIKLLDKKGGKSDFKDAFSPKLTAGVVVISDSTYQGKRTDKSGKIIKEFLENTGQIEVREYIIVPDNREKIESTVKSLTDDKKLHLVFTTGGTGFGPKDITFEAVSPLLERTAPGIAETIRRHGKERTPYAMLSREIAGTRGDSVIITLPGSSKGAKESLEALFPGLLHIYPMMWGGGHTKDGKAKL
ncbi:MAG: bifunctional molybdenum cofactor biosynthesis protein MoaC/MoaB [Calditrichia bacterium]